MSSRQPDEGGRRPGRPGASSPEPGSLRFHHASTVTTTSDTNITAVLLAFATIFAVCIVVNLVAGEEKLPRELRGTTPYFFGAAALLGILAWVKHARSQLPFQITEKDGRVAVEVVGRVRVEMPFEYSFTWHPVPVGRGLEMSALELAIMDKKGDCALLLQQTRGAAYAIPDWGPARIIPRRKEVSFSSAKVLELKPLIDRLVPSAILDGHGAAAAGRGPLGSRGVDKEVIAAAEAEIVKRAQSRPER